MIPPGSLDLAFRLLDLLLFHPGYEVRCAQCDEPITDRLGLVLRSPEPIVLVEAVWQHGGPGGVCPRRRRTIARQQ